MTTLEIKTNNVGHLRAVTIDGHEIPNVERVAASSDFITSQKVTIEMYVERVILTNDEEE